MEVGASECKIVAWNNTQLHNVIYQCFHIKRERERSVLLNTIQKGYHYVVLMADEWWKCMEHRRNNSDKGKPSDINLSHSHTVHLKFHKNWPGTEPCYPLCENSNQPPLPWHDWIFRITRINSKFKFIFFNINKDLNIY
jgi:hypothetical protein